MCQHYMYCTLHAWLTVICVTSFAELIACGHTSLLPSMHCSSCIGGDSLCEGVKRVVQGMNFIAGCLLLFMDEEDTFWCLAIIVEELLPGYYSMAMVEPQVAPSPAPLSAHSRLPHTLCWRASCTCWLYGPQWLHPWLTRECFKRSAAVLMLVHLFLFSFGERRIFITQMQR